MFTSEGGIYDRRRLFGDRLPLDRLVESPTQTGVDLLDRRRLERPALVNAALCRCTRARPRCGARQASRPRVWSTNCCPRMPDTHSLPPLVPTAAQVATYPQVSARTTDPFGRTSVLRQQKRPPREGASFSLVQRVTGRRSTPAANSPRCRWCRCWGRAARSSRCRRTRRTRCIGDRVCSPGCTCN